MPKMENLDEVTGFVNPIVDQDRSVHEKANALEPIDRAADVRIAPQKIDVVQDGLAESFGSRRKIIPRVGQDVFKIR